MHVIFFALRHRGHIRSGRRPGLATLLTASLCDTATVPRARRRITRGNARRGDPHHASLPPLPFLSWIRTPGKGRGPDRKGASRSRRLAAGLTIQPCLCAGGRCSARTGHAVTTGTASRPPGRVNAEDPAYAEEMGSHSYPDPPHKPFPPRYCLGRHIRNRLCISFLASAAPQATGHRRGS